MTDAQKNELVKKYIDGEVNDSILQLTVQEIIYLYSVILSRLGQNNENDEKTKKDRDLVFRAIILRIMRSEQLYIAYHIVTGYPYIDVKNNSWIFSEEKFANDAINHYLSYGIPLKIKKLEGNEIISELYELNRLGIEKLVVDNGHFSTVVYRSDLLREEELPEQPENQNPSLLFSLLTMNELAYASNGKNENIKNMIEEINKNISDSQFLVPVKMDKHLPDGEKLCVTDMSSVQIAVISNSQSKDSFIPAFTDWKEFIKMYSKDEWNAVIMTYEVLKDAASSFNGFIINPSGIMYVVNKDTQKAIDELKTK